MEKVTLMSGMRMVKVMMMMMMICLMGPDLPLGANAAPANGTKLAPFTLNTPSLSSQRSSQIPDQEAILPSKSSLSSPDSFGLDDSSFSTSYGPQEVVGEIGADDVMSHCLGNQYWDEEESECMNCTRCYPGTAHEHYYQPCGSGFGQKDVCQPCEEGSYQDSTSHTGLSCRGCIQCASVAEVQKECHARHNRECGPCPEGYFEFSSNVCEPCTVGMNFGGCKDFEKPTHPVTQSAALSTQETPPISNQTSPQPIGKLVHKLGGMWIALPFAIAAAFLGFIFAIWWVKRRYGLFWGTNESQAPADKQTPQLTPNTSNAYVEHIPKDDETPTTCNAEDHIYSAIGQPGRACYDARKDSTQGPEKERLLPVGAGDNRNPVFNPSDYASNVQAASNTLSMPRTLSSREQAAPEMHNGDEADRFLDSAPESSVQPGLPALMMGNYHTMSRHSEPNSPDSAKTNFSYENDEGSHVQFSIPAPLVSDDEYQDYA